MELDFEKAKSMATDHANKFNKWIVGAQENAEYWFFEADNDYHPFDDGAGSCYISKKDGTLRPLNPIDMEFNAVFDQTATDINMAR